ncbi:mycofactocin biosynthesis FMN-dependent deaminase MftD [Microbacterium sp. zg.B48]|uniref:pre-mycofactocin synthase MftD n=1 Tax=unclassified Microbacterium TaxID=2609290 RepID=UPI00214BB789|nr:MULTISPECIES: pre-mycofactocin synthase MftD [unclassified Microbacterium]MCR2765056.1 mycofactocin biosynthesis FMN-dependent deaminase MftD [Microbacterium sp. zg.B48]MCR2811235.1 mycofactocin biosynthesis FMN-dependent deaminase MftD [Microbacterium sp. zg.B185]WIM19834.1 mycofactocin biosynthesis FMN-dependent deaminase MftD [Microbacterium sp. zg-B185]
MPRNAWFETVAVAQRRARKRLPAPVYSALLAGSEKGTTYADNTAAFSELGLAPRVAGMSSARDLSVNVLGMDLALPVLISPTGVQAVHPDGEVAVARAAANRGTAMSLSSFASKSVEEVGAVTDKLNYQVYWQGSRDTIAARLDRARASGVKAIILTLDWSFSNGRDWGSPHIPEKLSLRAMAEFAPFAITKPAWLAEYLKRGTLPDLTVPNLVIGDEPAPTFFGAYGEWISTPPATWEDLAWLREQWDGPVMLKGITRVDDALRAVDAGMSAISVSNHGGNNLDSTPASIRLLPDIAAAVGDQIEVLLDGGIRRGSDVAKALALGAKAVMIGRAYLWGLAANGQGGVENVLDILRGGLDSAVLGLGHSSVRDLNPDDLWVPPGFTRRLGTPVG